MEMIPEIKDYGKEKGVQGLIQIVTQSCAENTKEQSIEIATRYFSKLQSRMERNNTSITDNEEDQIYETIMQIIGDKYD